MVLQSCQRDLLINLLKSQAGRQTVNSTATYLMNVTVTDNLFASSTCPAFTVNVKPTFGLTVNAKAKPDTMWVLCGGGSLSSLSGASVIVRTTGGVTVGSGPTDASGTITFSGVKRNQNLNICVTAPSSTGCTSLSADPACPQPEGSTAGCSLVTPPASGDLSKTFEFTQSVGEGWVTAIDGDVDANAL
jgi:hypothetical protein